jgi:hypothetical protein
VLGFLVFFCLISCVLLFRGRMHGNKHSPCRRSLWGVQAGTQHYVCGLMTVMPAQLMLEPVPPSSDCYFWNVRSPRLPNHDSLRREIIRVNHHYSWFFKFLYISNIIKINIRGIH